MNTPTISEAARRAAKTIEEEYVRSPRDGAAKRDIAAIIQTALDSAHPAPKEGETPETDANICRCETFEGGKYHTWEYVEPDFARSLELRLSEAKREVEALKFLYEDALMAAVGLTEASGDKESADPLLVKVRSLRAHLKTANELLGRAKPLIADEWVGTSDTSSGMVWLRDYCTHLNQQSK